MLNQGTFEDAVTAAKSQIDLLTPQKTEIATKLGEKYARRDGLQQDIDKETDPTKKAELESEMEGLKKEIADGEAVQSKVVGDLQRETETQHDNEKKRQEAEEVGGEAISEGDRRMNKVLDSIRSV